MAVLVLALLLVLLLLPVLAAELSEDFDSPDDFDSPEEDDDSPEALGDSAVLSECFFPLAPLRLSVL